MVRVLVIRLDPSAVLAGDMASTVKGFEHSHERAKQEDIDLTECLITLDEETSAKAMTTHLTSEEWDCVVIGGAIRRPEPMLEYFEYVVNLVHRLAPTSAIAFNSAPADIVESVLRALALGAD